MQATSPILDEGHLRGWIGRQETTIDTVSPELLRKFAATFDLGTVDPVPRLLHFCMAQPAAPTASLGDDGHPARGGFLPPVPLPRRMWAGGKLEFTGELRPDDTVRRVSQIEDVSVKEGRTGTLCFVTVRHLFDVEGLQVIDERQDIVYRGVDPAPASTPRQPLQPAPTGVHRREVDPTATLLFRYSALTFNGHRIHYDRPYTTQVEGYPGLVVHGPLQATLLMQFATDIEGRPPSRFSFRSQSPLFDGTPLVLHAKESDGKLELWTAAQDGPVAMAAEAQWQ